MTIRQTEEFELLNNDQLAVANLDQEFDTGCIREPLLFPLKAINSSMLDERLDRLDITLFEYNPLDKDQIRSNVSHLNKPFFSLGM